MTQTKHDPNEQSEETEKTSKEAKKDQGTKSVFSDRDFAAEKPDFPVSRNDSAVDLCQFQAVNDTAPKSVEKSILFGPELEG